MWHPLWPHVERSGDRGTAEYEKPRLKTQFAKDVFLAAFAYVLPSELKAEVARIIGYRFICTEHHTIIEITEVGDGLVRVHMSAERILKNISNQPQSLEGRFAIDEWGFDGRRSVIEQCTMEVGGEKLVAGHNSDPEYGQGDAIGFITQPRNIKSGETAKVVIKGYEFHRDNGVMLMGFRTPTIKPVVDLRLPDGFKHKCSFGVPGERIVQSEIAKRYTLDGAQFPSQNIWLRWWKPNASSSSAPPS